MPPDPLAPEVTVWTDAARAPLIARVLDRLGPAVHTIGVGGARAAEVNDLARRFDAPFEDDFRKLLVERPASFLLLAGADGAGHDDVAAAAARGTTVVALEPIGDSVEDLPDRRARPMLSPSNADAAEAQAAPARPGGRLLLAPSFLRSPGWTGASDPLDVIGPPRLLRFTGLGPTGAGSLYAQLFDAWQTLLALSGLPETIDASLVGPLRQVPESPRGLTGHLSLHARLPDGCAAVAQVSDLAGAPRRELEVIGERGALQAGDFHHRLLDAAGAETDGRRTDPQDAAELIVAQWRRLLDHAPATQPEPDEGRVLACCLATVLSARTGQPESPGMLLALH